MPYITVGGLVAAILVAVVIAVLRTNKWEPPDF